MVRVAKEKIINIKQREGGVQLIFPLTESDLVVGSLQSVVGGGAAVCKLIFPVSRKIYMSYKTAIEVV